MFVFKTGLEKSQGCTHLSEYVHSKMLTACDRIQQYCFVEEFANFALCEEAVLYMHYLQCSKTEELFLSFLSLESTSADGYVNVLQNR